MSRRSITRMLALAVTGTALSIAHAAPPAGSPAAATLSRQIINDARNTLSSPILPPDRAAAQASILLQFAIQLDDSDIHALRLLADTARAAGKADLERDTLRKIIAADPGDLVSQVHYIDLKASATQNLEERSGIFQGALDEGTLDAQLRSEMALRLARLEEARGNLTKCREYLEQSVRLNSVNVSALRDRVRLASDDDESLSGQIAHLNALTALLMANPFQSDAWVQAARLCEQANLHDRASDFLQTALEQSQMDGMPPNGELILELTIEQAVGGKRVEAFKNAYALSKFPDAPLAPLLVAELLAQDNVPGSGPVSPSTQPAAMELLPDIRLRLDELAKSANAGKPSPLADALGVDLTMLPAPGPHAQAWLDSYAKMVPADDPTLQRLRGWWLYRQNKLDDARAAFEKIGSDDPLSQLGLAKILLDQGEKAKAADIVEKLNAGHPTSLLALQISRLARNADITPAETPVMRQFRDSVARLTPSYTAMHRQPRDTVLMSVSYRKTAVATGEPAIINVRLTNTTDRPLPVGADGVIKTMIGLTGSTRGSKGALLGVYAVEDCQRVYRLEPHQIIETQMRADQGKLADLFRDNPSRNVTVGITAVAAPRILSATDFSAGVGGQALTPGDFDHTGLPFAAPADLQRILQDLAGPPSDKLLTRIATSQQLLTSAGDSAAWLPKDARDQLTTALTKLGKSDDAAVRAAIARETGNDTLATDSEPLVRLMWAESKWNAGTPAAATLAVLQKQSADEKSPLIKSFIDSLIPSLQSLQPPTTAPATTKP